MAGSDFKIYQAVPCSTAPPEIHFITRPGHQVQDIILLMTLLPEAQAHYSYVSLMNREGHLLLWNETQGVQVEMRRGTYLDLRLRLFDRKYLMTSPIGMVPQVEDLDVAVYMPYSNFLNLNKNIVKIGAPK